MNIDNFTPLEAVVKRAPLGLRFHDMAYATNVTDGLIVSAHPFDSQLPVLPAYRSPVSGIYGFYRLPGMKAYEDNEKPASDWCDSTSPPNWVISVEDTFERFLPQVMPMCLPKERLVVVEMYSSPVRSATAGYASVRGELWDNAIGQPASWALVSVSNGFGNDYIGVADARGMFVLFLAYPKPISGTPLNQQQWPLNVQVFYEPSTLRWSGQVNPVTALGETIEAAKRRIPPDTNTLVQQAAGVLFSTRAASSSSLTQQLRYRMDLVLATQGESRMWVAPA